MGTFHFLRGQIDLPARLVGRHPSDERSWLDGSYLTVTLIERVRAVRVHTGGRSFPDRPGSALTGSWFGIGDVVETSSEYANSHALPGPFTQTAWVVLLEGSTLNIGFSAPMFRPGTGGGEQAEFLEGPQPRYIPATRNVWHSAMGTA